MIFILWLLVWLFSIVHPFLNGIYLISFLEYEHNQISSMSLCKNVNIMIKIEYITHILLFVILSVFFNSTYIALILNVPIIIYHIKCYLDKSYELDPTDLYREIGKRKKEAIAHIIYYVILFGFYLYSFIRSVIEFESH
ncbi:hypothetical protein ABK040_001354 [Willaertia magna]